jgi:membrane associated rhomboid family serine protease
MVQRLLIANVVAWLAQMFLESSGVPITALCAVSVSGFFSGLLWQPFTYMWLHGGAMHLLFNMFGLWMFGGTLESVWGGRRFLRFYLTCGVGAGFIILAWNSLFPDQYGVPTLGASGAIYGVLTAFSLMWPDRQIMLLFPPIPIKAIWFIPVLFVLQIGMSGGGSNISHVGHLGGVLVAAYLMRAELRQYFGGVGKLRYRWHRYRMRKRLRAVRRDEWDKRKGGKGGKGGKDDDDDRPTFH